MRRLFIALAGAIIVLDIMVNVQALVNGTPLPPTSLLISMMLVVPLTFTLLN